MKKWTSATFGVLSQGLLSPFVLCICTESRQLNHHLVLRFHRSDFTSTSKNEMVLGCDTRMSLVQNVTYKYVLIRCMYVCMYIYICMDGCMHILGMYVCMPCTSNESCLPTIVVVTIVHNSPRRVSKSWWFSGIRHILTHMLDVAQAPTTPPARMPSSAKYLWLKTPTPGATQMKWSWRLWC